jgi:hypothetical protein
MSEQQFGLIVVIERGEKWSSVSICILKMMKQEARQIPVTIVVMKVNGVAVEKIQIDPTRRGEKMSDPTAEYLMAKSKLHQLNAIKLMEEQESEKALLN